MVGWAPFVTGWRPAVRRHVLVALALSSLIFLAHPRAQEPHADVKVLSVGDYLNYETVADAQISPAGTRIVYTRRWVNRIDDKTESSLWIMDADGARNRFLAEGSGAQWSPDGTRPVKPEMVAGRQTDRADDAGAEGVDLEEHDELVFAAQQADAVERQRAIGACRSSPG
jgi:hypothetical protein